MRLQKENLIRFLPGALLVIVWGWFYQRVLFGDNTFVLEDTSRFFFPLWKWGSEVWKDGWIPLWNPNAAFGTPYLADPQMAAWYPPIFLFYRVFHPVDAFNRLIMFHHLFALLGFYFYSRKRGFAQSVSFNGSIIYGFSFNAVCLTWATPMLFAFAWIPWVSMAADGLKNHQKGYFFFLSFALSMQLACGYPIFFYLTLLTLLIEEIIGWRVGKDWQKGLLKRIGTLGIALLYNSAWLLPFKEFIPYSNLTQRTSFSESLDWSDLASWLNPFFKGHPLYAHADIPFSVTVYFSGLPLLVMMIWGMLYRRGKLLSGYVFLTLVLLSLGETTFLGGWVKKYLPGYFLLVRSGYWIPFVIWAALKVFLESLKEMNGLNGKNKIQNIMLWGGLVFLVYGSALALGVPADLRSFWISFFCLFIIGISGSFYFRFQPVFLALSILFSLWPMAENLNFTMDRVFYEKPPLILTRMDRPGRIYQSSEWVDSQKTISGQSVYNAYQRLKQSFPPNLPLAWDKEEVSFSNTLFLNSFLRWYLWMDHTDRNTEQKLLNFFNVRYGMGMVPGFVSDSVIGGSNPSEILENNNLLPKWFSISKAHFLSDRQDIGNKILGTSFDFDKECFVRDESKAGDYNPRSVEELERTPCSIHLRVLGNEKALLVSSEMAYPGWRALVNGLDKPLELVNQDFRGIFLGAGEKDIHIIYRPISFRLGCFLSLLVCGLWLGLILPILRINNA